MSRSTYIVPHTALTVVAIFGLLLLMPPGCGSTEPADADGKPRVVTTTAMIADAVRSIAGDRVDVRSLMQEGVDPHVYRPSRDDVDRLLRADLVLYNGFLLEGKMVETFGQIRRAGGRIRAVAEAVPESMRREDPDAPGVSDPHVWMDPNLWSIVAEAVAEELRLLLPEAGDAIDAGLHEYRDEIAALDVYARDMIGRIPESQRVLVTAHDAFGYFADAYGLEEFGIQGLSTESEAALRDIERLVEMIVTRRIPAVFTETSVQDRNIEALIRGARARGHTVALGGALYSDAMGPAGTYEGTWIGMLDHNITMIARALGAEVPPRGMQGRLGSE